MKKQYTTENHIYQGTSSASLYSIKLKDPACADTAIKISSPLIRKCIFISYELQGSLPYLNYSNDTW